MFAVAVTTLAWMLEAWRTPATLDGTRFRKGGSGVATAPSPLGRLRFSLIVPARHEEAVLGATLDGLAALDVPELDPDLGRAAAHLDVVVVQDLPELAIELDGDTLAQLTCRDHRSWILLGVVGAARGALDEGLGREEGSTRGRCLGDPSTGRRSHPLREGLVRRRRRLPCAGIR